MKLLLIALFLNIFCENVYLEAFPLDMPEWSPTYTIKGILTHSNGEIVEPFEAWYDGINGNSRVNYHGGIVSQFQLSNEGEFGRFYRFVPVVKWKKCQKIDVKSVVRTNETNEVKRIKPQSVLPDLVEFKFNGTETIVGRKCHRFLMVTELADSSFYFTYMWVQYKVVGKKYHRIEYIPVRYEQRNIDAIEGLLSWYKLDYESYKTSITNSKKVFKVTDNGCRILPHFKENVFNRMSYFIQSNQNIEHNIEDTESDDDTDDESDEYDESDDDDNSSQYEYDEHTLARLPESLDWRFLGAVSPVRDQTNVCGSCWAFSAVGAVEAALYIHNGMKEFVRLSEQALIDCAWSNGNDGCVGGFDSAAFEWIKDNGGIPTDESYGKYRAMEGICHANDSNVVLKAPISGWARVRSGDSNAMKLALVKHGPVSATMYASERFLHYTNSDQLFFDPDCKNTTNSGNHVVLVVGYGKTEDGEDYWILRNSHGVEWGNNGYMLMAARDNHCGILSEPLYPILDEDLYQ